MSADSVVFANHSPANIQFVINPFQTATTMRTLSDNRFHETELVLRHCQSCRWKRQFCNKKKISLKLVVEIHFETGNITSWMHHFLKWVQKILFRSNFHEGLESFVCKTAFLAFMNVNMTHGASFAGCVVGRLSGINAPPVGAGMRTPESLFAVSSKKEKIMANEVSFSYTVPFCRWILC